MNKPTNEHEYSKQHMKHGPWTTNLTPPNKKKTKNHDLTTKMTRSNWKELVNLPPKKENHLLFPPLFSGPFPSLLFTTQELIRVKSSPLRLASSDPNIASKIKAAAKRFEAVRPIPLKPLKKPDEWNPIWLEAETDNKKSQKVKLVVFFFWTGALFFRGELGGFFLCSENWGLWKEPPMYLVIQVVTFLGWWKRDPFKGVSDLQLGDEVWALWITWFVCFFDGVYFVAPWWCR